MVKCINSRLRPKAERKDPVALDANAGLAFQGSIVLGMGFTFDDSNADATSLTEMEQLIAKDRKNQQRIFPYLGGKEVNDSPTQSHHRYVINFGEMTLEEAEAWPDLLAIVRQKVKPERDKNKRAVRKKYWWRFGETTPALYAALKGRKRCLVTATLAKHLAFSWQPIGRVYSQRLYVFPIEDNARFAVLQSRLHGVWVRLLSSTFGDGLHYLATDCLNNFPFPSESTLGSTSKLEQLGEALDAARRSIMTASNHGLTDLYNKLKDPDDGAKEIVALRTLHEEVDRAVLDAYGWEVAVPPYQEPADSPAMQAFADEVLDRLFALNEKRAAEELTAKKRAR